MSARTREKNRKTEQIHISPIGRCSFPNLAVINEYDGKFSIALLLDRNLKHFDEDVWSGMKRLVAQEMTLAKKEYGQHARLQSPFRDAGEKDHLAGYKAGDILVSFRSKTRPVVIDARQNELDPNDPEGIYAGCLIRVKHSIFHYDKKGKKGVAFGLTCVQKCGDGEPFGHISTSEGMDDIEIDDGGAEINDLFDDDDDKESGDLGNLFDDEPETPF